MKSLSYPGIPRHALTASALRLSATAWCADVWPVKPVRMVVPFAGGGSANQRYNINLPVGSPASDFSAFVRAEHKYWVSFVQAAGIKID